LLAAGDAHAARPHTGFWYGDGAANGPGSEWWMSFRVVNHRGRTLVTDITASTHAQDCHVEIDPEARRVKNGSVTRPGQGINLGTLAVDGRGRFGDRARGRQRFFVRARFTRPGHASGVLRWNDPAMAGPPTCVGESLIGRERFKMAPAGPPPLAAGPWSGVLAAQEADGQRIAEQPLGFSVLPGGRFMHFGRPQFELLVHCSTEPDLYQPIGVGISAPFGSVRGRRAVPPRADFTLDQEPLVLGDGFLWHIDAADGRASGEVGYTSLGPASGCAGSVPWAALGPD
jgi:hypothetical protein